MKPVARGHTAHANVPPAQNFLPDERDHDGVINIMVCGVAGCDVFKGKLGDKADHARVARLHCPICSFVHRSKFADKGFYNYQCWVEHEPTSLRARRGAAPTEGRWWSQAYHAVASKSVSVDRRRG